jgi:hypothetical protein
MSNLSYTAKQTVLLEELKLLVEDNPEALDIINQLYLLEHERMEKEFIKSL